MADSIITSQLRFSDAATKKLHSSGIAEEDAVAAGIIEVDSAKDELSEEFADVPALVFQYFDVSGQPVFFEREGEILQFVRIRYLADPPSRGFIRTKPQRYAQLKASGVHAYFPKVEGVNWREIVNDPSFALAITEGELKALKATLEGLPTIGITGVDCFMRKLEPAR